jgi:hypothetical protein
MKIEHVFYSFQEVNGAFIVKNHFIPSNASTSQPRGSAWHYLIGGSQVLKTAADLKRKKPSSGRNFIAYANNRLRGSKEEEKEDYVEYGSLTSC